MRGNDHWRERIRCMGCTMSFILYSKDKQDPEKMVELLWLDTLEMNWCNKCKKLQWSMHGCSWPPTIPAPGTHVITRHHSGHFGACFNNNKNNDWDQLCGRCEWEGENEKGRCGQKGCPLVRALYSQPQSTASAEYLIGHRPPFLLFASYFFNQGWRVGYYRFYLRQVIFQK